MVIVSLPGGVVWLAQTVYTEDPDPEIDKGAKVPVTPAGKALWLNDTEPLKPNNAATETLKLVHPPGSRASDEGDMETV